MYRIFFLIIITTFLNSFCLLAKDISPKPIKKVEAKYPNKAKREGLEGWVRLSFDINEVGGVENIKVIDSSSKKTFGREAKKALKKWKFEAKIVDGKRLRQSGLVTQIDFNLDPERRKNLEAKKNNAEAKRLEKLEIDAKNRAEELKVMSSQIGVRICRPMPNTQNFVEVGFVEAHALPRIKISITDHFSTINDGNIRTLSHFRAKTIWDKPENWKVCEE